MSNRKPAFASAAGASSDRPGTRTINFLLLYIACIQESVFLAICETQNFLSADIKKT